VLRPGEIVDQPPGQLRRGGAFDASSPLRLPAGPEQARDQPPGNVRRHLLILDGVAEQLQGCQGLPLDPLRLEEWRHLAGERLDLRRPSFLQEEHRQLQGGESGVVGDGSGKKLARGEGRLRALLPFLGDPVAAPGSR
jgi:hypothetical protein